MRRIALGLSAIAALMAASPVLAEKKSAEIPIVRDVPQGCVDLGEVRASSLIGGALAGAGYNAALKALRARAAALGATHIQLVYGNNGFTGSQMLGRAMRCSPVAEELPVRPS